MLLPGDARSVAAATTAADHFGRLYERAYPCVFAFAYRRTGDRTRAEDVTAQTFLQALQAYERYEERGAPVTAWLLRIAANVVYEQARRERRTPQAVPASACPVEWHNAVGDHAGDWAERVERGAWIDDYLAPLSPPERRAVWLRYGEDWAIDRVAAELGRSPGATKQLLHRAIKTLRARAGAGEATATPAATGALRPCAPPPGRGRAGCAARPCR